MMQPSPTTVIIRLQSEYDVLYNKNLFQEDTENREMNEHVNGRKDNMLSCIV